MPQKDARKNLLQQKSVLNLFLTFQILLILLLNIFLIAAVGVMTSEYVNKSISGLIGLSAKNETLTFLGFGMGGVLVALQALMSYKRAKAMEDTANAQAKATEEQATANKHTEQGQRQERMKNAIEHLGDKSDSVRLGGSYELFHLAKDVEELRQTVLDILCAHIRQTTRDKEYREMHRAKPSEEIQSLLTLIFLQQHEVFNDLHVNLQGTWLNGANLSGARLLGADLTGAHLQRTKLQEANLQDAKLQEAHLQRAFLQKTLLQRAFLQKTLLQAAKLQQAQLQGAFLERAQLQRAELPGAQLQGAFLEQAQLQGAELNGAHLQGAFLEQAQLQGAELNGVQLQGAKLQEAHLQGAMLCLAQLQGTTLSEGHLQGVELFKACLQGAELYKADLRGTKSGNRHPRKSFKDRIRESIDNETDLSRIIFKGGMNRKEVDFSITGLSDENAERLRVELEAHIGKPDSNQLPEDSRAITGTYSEEEANKWIAEYEQAMSKVPGDDNQCRL